MLRDDEAQTAPAERPQEPPLPESDGRGSGRAAQGEVELLHWTELRGIPRREALVEDLLDSTALSVLYGPPGTCKTFFAIDLSRCLADGTPWRGRRVRRCAVLYVVAEGGRGFVDRLEAMRLHHCVPEDIPLFVSVNPINLRSPENDGGHVSALIEKAKALPLEPGLELGLVVIDTLSRAMAGGNENGAEDMGAFVMQMDRIRAETGAHVMLVHHSGKDEAKGARGHSLLRAAADTELSISGTQPIVSVRSEKQRDHRTGETFAFKTVEVPLPPDESGRVRGSLALAECEAVGQVTARRPKLSPQTSIALSILQNEIDRSGEILPATDRTPRNVKGISLSLWRTACGTHGLVAADNSKDKSEALRKAFKRAFQTLQDKEIIGFHNDRVWLAR
ncbi:MAG: AAA family ATPase [Tistlia sp.]|uniref:AAA family ATPase n=1 Tax=Tistlia sp. TaxID=3057121 RepID=UPI0034A4363B